MKTIKLLLSGLLLLTFFFGTSQERDGLHTKSAVQATKTNKTLKPQEGQQMLGVKESNKSSKGFVAGKTANYEVTMAPVFQNRTAVTKFLLKFLGSDKKGKVNALVKNGGTVMQNLNQQEATAMAKQLRKLGVRVKILKMNSSGSSFETNVSNNDTGENITSVYEVTMKPVKRNQPGIFKFLLRQLGPNEKNTVSLLIKNGGTVPQSLSKKAANAMAKQLKKLGAQVEVNTMDNEVSKEHYIVKLLSAGKDKKKVIKVIRSLTNLNLKESKDIVDRLGVVGENLPKKVAKRFKRMLENAGARVEIESMPSLSGKK